MTLRYDILYLPLGAAAYGGAERSLLELASAQQASGRRVLVGYEAALKATPFIEHARQQGLTLVEVGWAPGQPLRSICRAALGMARGVQAGLVHFNISWRQGMWAVPLMFRLGSRARLVGTMRAMPEPYERIPRGRVFGVVPSPRLWMWPDLAMGRVWARCLHATVSVNRDDYPPRLVKEFAFRERALSVIYNGVKVPGRAPSAEDKAMAKRALGYTDAELLVAYVGRVSAEKGLRYMIDALPACGPQVRLVIAGEGDELDAIRQRAAAAGVLDRVRFLGFVERPFEVFTAADIAVVPSLWNEAFGRVVVEAMACRTAVIATSVGGMRELFEHGQEGLFVPKEDAMALAAAVNSMAANPEQLQAMQQRGRQLAEDRYSTGRVAREYGELYERVSAA
jgi:glycosyltransferase involved in cell wall biosynthesis